MIVPEMPASLRTADKVLHARVGEGAVSHQKNRRLRMPLVNFRK